MATPIYLDYAAATPLDKRVLAAMHPYLTTDFYNPSATYERGRLARRAFEAARAKVALCLGARASEVIFTAGGTEANNLAIHGVMRKYPDANMVLSTIEHSAVIKPAAHYDCRQVDVQSDGIIDPLALKAAIDDHTVLVSIMYANNEIGTVQPLRAIARLIADVRKQRRKDGNDLPLYLHSDACQAPNYLDIHTARLGVDLLSLNGSKIYGPKQSGALYVKGGIVLQPLVDGGGQERGLRSGTENVAGAVGFAAALELAATHRHEEVRRLQALQQEFYKNLEVRIPEVHINGSRSRRLPNNIHLTIPGQDNERLLIGLDEAGVMAAAGSACSASSQAASTVLASIGLSDDEARASLRFSMGRGTTSAEIKRAISVLAGLLA